MQEILNGIILIFTSFSKESFKIQFYMLFFVKFLILTPQPIIVRTSTACNNSLVCAQILTNIHIYIQHSEKHKF